MNTVRPALAISTVPVVRNNKQGVAAFGLHPAYYCDFKLKTDAKPLPYWPPAFS